MAVAPKTPAPKMPIPYPYPHTPPLLDPQATTGNFETDLDPAIMSATIAAKISEVDGESPASVIDINEDWFVDVNWQLSGPLEHLICGSWCVRLFLENIGPGGDDEEFQNQEGLISLNPCGDGNYRALIPVPAGTIPVENCGTPYQAVVGVTYLTPCLTFPGSPADTCRSYIPGPFAAFVSFKIMQFFAAGVEF